MKASAIYLKAAKLIDDCACNRACVAIESAQGRDYFDGEWGGDTPALTEYVDLILCGEEISSILYGSRCDSGTARDARVIALLLAHAIALDEEKIAGRIGGK